MCCSPRGLRESDMVWQLNNRNSSGREWVAFLEGSSGAEALDRSAGGSISAHSPRLPSWFAGSCAAPLHMVRRAEVSITAILHKITWV